MSVEYEYAVLDIPPPSTSWEENDDDSDDVVLGPPLEVPQLLVARLATSTGSASKPHTLWYYGIKRHLMFIVIGQAVTVSKENVVRCKSLK